MFIVYTLQKYSVHFQDQNGEVLTKHSWTQVHVLKC